MMQGQFFFWLLLVATRRRAMQRSKLDIGRADTGAGGMSIRSGMGASSSSSDASAMAQSTGSLRIGAGSGSMCIVGEEIVTRCPSLECRGLCDGLAELGVAAMRASDAIQLSKHGTCFVAG